MNLENKNKEIPEEFKFLSEDFSKNGFITTYLRKQTLKKGSIGYICEQTLSLFYPWPVLG